MVRLAGGSLAYGRHTICDSAIGGISMRAIPSASEPTAPRATVSTVSTPSPPSGSLACLGRPRTRGDIVPGWACLGSEIDPSPTHAPAHTALMCAVVYKYVLRTYIDTFCVVLSTKGSTSRPRLTRPHPCATAGVLGRDLVWLSCLSPQAARMGHLLLARSLTCPEELLATPRLPWTGTGWSLP